MGFTRDEYQCRLRRVVAALRQVGFDALIAYSIRNQPGPVAYLAGYEPSLGIHDMAFLVVTPGARPPCVLITNAFWDHPAERTWVDEVIITSEFASKLAEALPEAVRRIGIAGYRVFPAPVYRAVQTAFPATRFDDASALLMEAAWIKSPEEVAAIRRCMQITDAGGRAFLESVRSGANEREVQLEVERAIWLAGADDLSFPTHLYSGPQVALGIGLTTGRTLGRGEQVQVDCGAVHRGYRVDFSRVTTVDTPTREARRIMDATADMYEAMLGAMQPGVPLAELAQVGLAMARQRGLQSCLYRSPNHPTGFVAHGTGCWQHEAPHIHPAAVGILQENMTISLEPILGQPGAGGAKIADTVLVTAHGAERLSSVGIRTWPA
ncbi:MAG TPA: Xaa-Pro peptidase family protein [Anaerolineae bacterium]|nr:Xaa-Pro peptidase family protein [Anaerolineae bacterium]